MNLRQKDYEVGYKRPPQHTQWKKGQCGNPKREYKRAPKGTVALIDAAFEARIDIVENGASRRVSVLEAILIQLWIKEMSGDKASDSCPFKISGIWCKPGWPTRVYHRTCARRAS